MSGRIPEATLDERIAAAFGDAAKSADVAALIKQTEAASLSNNDAAERARKRALDPILSANDLAEARRQMEDAAFQRDRLQTAVTRLRERLGEVKAQEEDQRRQLAVKPQEVIPGHTESADRWLACEANMRPVPVVAMEPSGQRGISLL